MYYSVVDSLKTYLAEKVCVKLLEETVNVLSTLSVKDQFAHFYMQYYVYTSYYILLHMILQEHT